MIHVKILLGSARRTSCRVCSLRTYSQTKQSSAISNDDLAINYYGKFTSYRDMIQDAKSRARRSVLIDNCGNSSIQLREELWDGIEQVYRIRKQTNRNIKNLSLIEFKSEESASDLVRRAMHNEGWLPISMKVLKYNTRSTQSTPTACQFPFPINDVVLNLGQELSPRIDKITDLISNNMMSLAALKLRFITLVNIEDAVCSGLFKEYELIPFGSSVMHTGYNSSDLDLVFNRKAPEHQRDDSDSELVHLDKSVYSEYRNNTATGGAIDYICFILREFLPLTDGPSVLPLKRARVPIIKFTSLVTDIDCDMSFNLGIDEQRGNNGGIDMTEVMYRLCRRNNLVTAMIIYLKVFAKLTGITSKEPNIAMTNFQFQATILYFLQVESIVPPLQEVMSSSDASITLDESEIIKQLPQLIMRFAKFYSRFDFANLAINLNEGKTERKRDNSALYIMYPFEANRNICQNVTRKGLDQLRKGMDWLVHDPVIVIKLILENINKRKRSARRVDLDDLYTSQRVHSPEDIYEEICR